MTDIVFPTLTRSAPPEVQWRHKSVAQIFQSPFDGSTQTGSFHFGSWYCAMTWPNLEEADASLLQAFLMKLRGRANRALVHNFARPVPRGTINLSGVTVNGALSAGASQLTLAGCGNAKTLLTGDFFSVGGEFKMVVDGPYTSDAGGAMANVKFEPPLRAAVSNGAAVTLDKPTCTMMVVDPEALGWSTRAPILTDVPLEFMEAFA